MKLVKKLKLELTSWRNTINLPNPVENVSAVKVKWITYTTASAGNKELSLSCDKFNQNGDNIFSNGSNAKYFFSFPIDPANDVTCVYTNPLGDIDATFETIRSLDRFIIEISINGAPSNDITSLNPVNIELGFYE
jgi:hypothetical protein